MDTPIKLTIFVNSKCLTIIIRIGELYWNVSVRLLAYTGLLIAMTVNGAPFHWRPLH